MKNRFEIKKEKKNGCNDILTEIIYSHFFFRPGIDIFYERIPWNTTVPPIPGAENDRGPLISDQYTKPWARTGPYTVGMVFGYILFAKRNNIKPWTFRINKVGLSLIYVPHIIS